jgi:lysophospholipase
MDMLPIEPPIAIIKKRLKRIDLSRVPVSHDSEKAYFKYYGLDFPAVSHHFGLLRHRRFTLATHIFLPKNYHASVVMVHGYLEHSCYFKHAVRHLLKEGYGVVLFDLPGHGFSSGPPAAISNFAFYADALDHVIRYCRKRLKKPLHLVAHSMGCSVAVEFLLAGRHEGIDKTILVAPLVHPTLWQATRFAYRVLNPIITKVPRAFPVLSSDKEFLLFSAFRDPLLRKKIPLQWVHALFRWNERLAKYPKSQKKVFIIQGTHDLLVDGEYNVAYLKNKFPGAVVSRIKNANHQLFNESPSFRTPLLRLIKKYLSNVK